MGPEPRMEPPRPLFGVFTIDADLVVRTWDPFLASMTGIAANDALNHPVCDVVPDLEPRGLLDVFRRVVATGTVEVLAPALHRYLIACAPAGTSAGSGQMRQRVTIAPIREDGRITGAAVTVEDVTARLEREKELAELTGALGDRGWRTRQAAVRGLAAQGSTIVETLVRTLREQHHNFNVLSSMLDLLATADIDVVEPLIDCVSSEEADLRMQAALILGERRDPRAIPALIKALDDPDANVRFHAIEALGELRALEAAPRLVEVAAGGDFFLAFPAIQALSRFGESSVAPRLVPLLHDELLRASVTEALGAIGDELVVEPLVTLLNQPAAPTEVVADALAGLYERYEERYGAGEHIADLVRRSINAAGSQNLLDAVNRVGPDRLQAVARVLGWLRGQAVQRALTRLLAQPSVRAQIVEALVRYGAGVVDLLVAQLGAEDLDTRQAAAVALGRIGDRRATGALVAALDDPELAVPAAGALARLGDADAFDALIGLLGHSDAAVRTAAIGALNSIGHRDMPSRVLPLLDDDRPVVRESAVRVAGYFGYEQCVDRVLERCGDSSEAVRRAAVEHLPLFADPAALSALVGALENDTSPVRAAAAAALARVDEADALGPLMRALNDIDPWVRYFAVRSIGRFGNPVSAPAIQQAIERDGAGQVRLAAIEVLGRLAAPDALRILEPLTGSAEADIARAAIRALGHVPDDRAHEILERLLRSRDISRRLEAIAAIGDRGGREAVPALQWVAAADDNQDVVSQAILALARLSAREAPDANAATTALTMLTGDRRPRELAIAALSGLAPRRTADVAAGLRHASPAIRRATVEALSRMRNPEASKLLETALDDPDPAVRAAAVAELRRLGSRHASKKLLALARTDPDTEVRRVAMVAVTQQRGGGPADDRRNGL